jgi:hypothetical protein
MDATRIDLNAAMPLGAAPAGAADGSAEAIAGKWAALHEAATVVAALAGIAAEPRPDGLPQALHAASAPARAAADQAVDDLAAIMEPGLAALIAVHGGGRDPAAPAQALWREFVAARDGLLALLAAGPTRRA